MAIIFSTGFDYYSSIVGAWDSEDKKFKLPKKSKPDLMPVIKSNMCRECFDDCFYVVKDENYHLMFIQLEGNCSKCGKETGTKPI
jgi:hypothetical protein